MTKEKEILFLSVRHDSLLVEFLFSIQKCMVYSVCVYMFITLCVYRVWVAKIFVFFLVKYAYQG